jgi:hypothetical protein
MMLLGRFPDFVEAVPHRGEAGQRLKGKEGRKTGAGLLLPCIFNLSPLAFSLLPVVQ